VVGATCACGGMACHALAVARRWCVVRSRPVAPVAAVSHLEGAMDLAGSLVPGNRSASGMPVRTAQPSSPTASRSLCRIVQARSERPISLSCSMARAWSKWADARHWWPRAVSMRSFMKFRRRRSGRSRDGKCVRALRRPSATRSPTGRGCNRVFHFVATANS
jgi:hypothetical protein